MVISWPAGSVVVKKRPDEQRGVLETSSPTPESIRAIGEIEFIGTVGQKTVHRLDCGIRKLSRKEWTVKVQQFIRPGTVLFTERWLQLLRSDKHVFRQPVHDRGALS